jgi:hypothetical protein
MTKKVKNDVHNNRVVFSVFEYSAQGKPDSCKKIYARKRDNKALEAVIADAIFID